MKRFFKLVQVPAREIRAGQPHIVTFAKVQDAVADPEIRGAPDWALHEVEGSVSVYNMANLLQGRPVPKTKEWPFYTVRYWNHIHDMPGHPANDCFGNSMVWMGKARSRHEAVKKAKKHSEKWTSRFRLNTVEENS